MDQTYGRHPTLDLSKLSNKLKSSLKNPEKSDFIFLIMSGSFNPIHAFHIQILELAKRYMERLGKTVVGGFIAPSSDAYVFNKLGKSSISLKRRLDLCHRALQHSDWISVCGWGEYSSNKIRWNIQKVIAEQFKDILGSNEILGTEIMGSDTFVRLLDIILNQEKNKIDLSGRSICCFIRNYKHAKNDRTLIKEWIIPAIYNSGMEFHLIDEVDFEEKEFDLSYLSSTFIRRLIEKNAWNEIESKTLLPYEVFSDLKKHNL